jgi:hypothetical protein
MVISQLDALLLDSRSPVDTESLQRIQPYMIDMLPLAGPETRFLAGA